MKFTAAITMLLFITGCGKTATNGMDKTDTTQIINPVHEISYLALGDSYTIGEAVPQKDCFPFQLADMLRTKGIKLNTPKIIAKTGWTTDELQAGIASDGVKSQFDLVTLLIGVNNQYRGNSIITYRREFKELLQKAIQFAGGNKKHVFVISIPDWAATPFGRESGRPLQEIAKQIDAFNAVNREESIAAGVSYTDITPGSRNALQDTGLVASDGLHPSAKMYKEWVMQLSPSVIEAYK